MKQSYKKRRQAANVVNQKIRKTVEKIIGKKLPKKIEVDDIKPIKKGGSPTDLRNKRLISKTANRKKAAR